MQELQKTPVFTNLRYESSKSPSHTFPDDTLLRYPDTRKNHAVRVVAKGGGVSEQLARQFVTALGKLEQERDLETIASLFSENAEIDNVTSAKGKEGKQGAREFWRVYRETFDEMKSTFRNQIFMDGRAALEWVTTGSSKNGHSVEYEGVSILEIEGDKITRFYAYFDPRKLGKQLEDTSQGGERA